MGCRRNNEKVKSSYKGTLQDVKTMINALAGGKQLDYYAVIHITKSIYKNIANMDYLTTYLLELHNYDDYTYSHCINVAFYAMLIGKWLHMPNKEIFDLIQAGLLHDIGKVKIPKNILNKNCKLTDSEFMIMKQHSSIGYDMLKSSDKIDSSIKEAILMHHERIDGTGYPTGATGEKIGNYAKIIAVADVYDAMISDRPYKRRSTPFEAFHMFTTIGTSIYETSIVRVFLLNIACYLVGAKILLDNGDIGEIVYIPPDQMDKPIICVMSTYFEISNDTGPRIVCVL